MQFSSLLSHPSCGDREVLFSGPHTCWREVCAIETRLCVAAASDPFSMLWWRRRDIGAMHAAEESEPWQWVGGPPLQGLFLLSLIDLCADLWCFWTIARGLKLCVFQVLVLCGMLGSAETILGVSRDHPGLGRHGGCRVRADVVRGWACLPLNGG